MKLPVLLVVTASAVLVPLADRAPPAHRGSGPQLAQPCAAATGAADLSPGLPADPPEYTDPARDAAMVADGKTGEILYTRNAGALRHPASLTKMMTLYLLFDAMARGEVSRDTMLTVSRHAAAQDPTNLDLAAGDMIPVD